MNMRIAEEAKEHVLTTSPAVPLHLPKLEPASASAQAHRNLVADPHAADKDDSSVIRAPRAAPAHPAPEHREAMRISDAR